VVEAERAASPAALVQLIWAFRASQALHVTATLGIADLLAAGPRTADDLARATGTHPRALYRLLRAVASVGVLTEGPAGEGTGGLFALTDLGQFLRTDHPRSVHGLAAFAASPTLWGTWQHLRHSVATGEPAFRHLHGVDIWTYREQHPDEGAAFDAAMTSLSLQQRDAVVAGNDFSGARTVVGAVVAFTAHHVVAAAVPAAEVLARLPPGVVGAPTGAPFLAWLARRLDAVGGGLDAVLLAPPASGAGAGVEEDGAPPALVPHPGPAGHPRVARARRLRREVAVYVDPAGRGLVTLGRRLAPAGAPLFAQVSPGNAASLRAFLAAGFRPVGAEVLLLRDTVR
jgi:hypothetical protein